MIDRASIELTLTERPPATPWEDLGGHRVGGYPYGHGDPEVPDGHVLLFQLDSDAHDDEWRIMWGDLGTGRFTISTDDLVQREFSAVQYDWDCA